jgi:predicted nucleotidyltransferase
MILKIEDRKKIEAEIKDILNSYIRLSEYKLFFFGSRVMETGGDRSDIDIGILGEKIDDTDMFEIQDKIKELEIPYSINLIDFCDVSDSFKETAMKNVEYFLD